MTLPRWTGPNEVGAFKIGGIARRKDMTVLSDAAREDSTHVIVDQAWMFRHKPAMGGYYVVDADGVGSFSPAEVFESNYTRID